MTIAFIVIRNNNTGLKITDKGACIFNKYRFIFPQFIVFVILVFLEIISNRAVKSNKRPLIKLTDD